MSEPKICVLIPYYGRWPVYLPLYLKSCAGNPTVDFLFLTDLKPPGAVPENVRFQPLSLAEFRELASAKLGFPVACENGYKLCDFRPAFGLIFADYLREYHFWAHGDIDLIYGDIRRFFTSALLADHDILSIRREWISGPLTLFRNCETVNQLFRDEPAHVTVMQTPEHRCFDETAFAWGQYKQSDDVLQELDLPPSMTLIVKRAAAEGRIRAHFHSLAKEVMRFHDVIRWEAGRVFHEDKEYAFYHFHNNKRDRIFRFPDWIEVPDRFFIRSTGISTDEYRPLLRIVPEPIYRAASWLARRRAA
jgi:hypothetical protein